MVEIDIVREEKNLTVAECLHYETHKKRTVRRIHTGKQVIKQQ